MTRKKALVDIGLGNATVYLALGSAAIAFGALKQMWNESNLWRARLYPTLKALDSLTEEQRQVLAKAEDVHFWNMFKRRKISAEAKAESLKLLTDQEKAFLDESDRSGTAWVWVCGGSVITLVGAILSVTLK